jgi:hypothetical protein
MGLRPKTEKAQIGDLLGILSEQSIDLEGISYNPLTKVLELPVLIRSLPEKRLLKRSLLRRVFLVPVRRQFFHFAGVDAVEFKNRLKEGISEIDRLNFSESHGVLTLVTMERMQIVIRAQPGKLEGVTQECGGIVGFAKYFSFPFSEAWSAFEPIDKWSSVFETL